MTRVLWERKGRRMRRRRKRRNGKEEGKKEGKKERKKEGKKDGKSWVVCLDCLVDDAWKVRRVTVGV